MNPLIDRDLRRASDQVATRAQLIDSRAAWDIIGTAVEAQERARFRRRARVVAIVLTPMLLAGVLTYALRLRPGGGSIQVEAPAGAPAASSHSPGTSTRHPSRALKPPSSKCGAISNEQCRAMDDLLAFTTTHAAQFEQLGTRVVNVYTPPLTVVFLTGTLTAAVRQYVRAHMPADLRGQHIELIEGERSQLLQRGSL